MEFGFGFMPGINSNYTEQEVRSYIYRKLEDTPQTGKGVTHTVKKGENLWSIAQKYLGRQKPSNNEIQDFMYKIAKLNDRETLEDFNRLDVNDTLYIPANESLSNKTSKTQNEKTSGLSNYEKVMNAAKHLQNLTAPEPSDSTYSQKILRKYEKIEKVPNEAFEAHGHAGFNNWADELKNNKNLKLENSYSTSVVKPSAVVFMKKVGNTSQTEAMLIADINPDGTLKKISFEAPGFDVKGASIDYIVDENRNLLGAKPQRYGYIPLGKISEEEYSALKEAIEPRIKAHLGLK